jgi:hypothetical protein
MALHLFLLRFQLRWSGWWCFLLLVAFMGCADPSDHHRGGAEDVGAISFSINWQDADIPDTPAALFSCGSGSDQVAFVDAQIFNPAHTINLNAPWACADSRGSIEQVPVGSGYTLTLSAYNQDGVVLYGAERIEITILPGVNDLGVLNGIPFETSPVTPAPDATDVNPTSPHFSWEAVSGAAGYRLLIATSADLASPIYTDTIDDVSVILADNVLQAGNEYWWGVVPIDFDGRLGQLNVDQVYAFSTSLSSSAPPVISFIYDELLDTAASCVDTDGNTFTGYDYLMYFDYEDSDGDAGESDGAYIIINDYFWDWVAFDGDGASGSVTVNYCSSTAGDRVTVRMVDGDGQESDPLTIDLSIP